MRGAVLIAAVLVAGPVLPAPAVAAPAAPAACPWVGSTAPVATRVAQVLGQMTLDEKIAMVHGTAAAGYTGRVAGNSRLCVPSLKLEDGPLG